MNKPQIGWATLTGLAMILGAVLLAVHEVPGGWALLGAGLANYNLFVLMIFLDRRGRAAAEAAAS